MVIHSDSGLGLLLAVLVTIAAVVVPLLMCIGFAIDRNYRGVAKLMLAALGAMAGWAVIVGFVSAVTPRTIVKLGDSYCVDIVYIGIDKVSKEMSGERLLYKLDVHLFSEANTVKTGF